MWIDMSAILSLFLLEHFTRPFVSRLTRTSPLHIVLLAAHHFGPNRDLY